jgi:membrane protease YdiL (CAAX protease family)
VTRWTAFVGLTGVVLTLLLVLARLSQTMFRDEGSPFAEPQRATPPLDAAVHDGPGDSHGPPLVPDLRDGDAAPATPATDSDPDPSEFSTGMLLVNVALTQGVFGALIIGGAFYAAIPPAALGITGAPSNSGLPAILLGAGLGSALWVSNELGAAGAGKLGFDTDENLREALAPATFSGWLVLLFLVLPIIAGVEELLFRAALIGATMAAPWGTPAWALVIVSTVAFAVGHGAQGPAGILVTGLLGLVLAIAFVETGSFVVVAVAHYVVNAMEFIVHELLELPSPV